MLCKCELRRSGLSWLLLLVLAFPHSTARAVEFADSLEKVQSDNPAQKPVVVSFGAGWCGWCRKMETDTFQSKDVNALAEKFLWVKIDVDDNPEISARFQVEGLPRTIVMDHKGRILGSSEGYLSPGRFVKFLNDSLTNPLADSQAIEQLLSQLAEAKEWEPARKNVRSVVEILAQPNRQSRAEILAALKSGPQTVRGVLLELMSDPRLSIRASAAGALQHCVDDDLAFDPFANKQTREKQLVAWRDALQLPIPPKTDSPLTNGQTTPATAAEVEAKSPEAVETKSPAVPSQPAEAVPPSNGPPPDSNG